MFSARCFQPRKERSKSNISKHKKRPPKELVEKYAMPKTSIYRKRDDALKKLKKILGNT